MIRTYLDSGVLLKAYQSDRADSDIALKLFEDDQRSLAMSDLVRLETLPQASYHKKRDEVEFMTACFGFAAHFVTTDANLIKSAETLACRYGLHAIDSLHVAAALKAGCEELITTERATKPIFRVKELRIIPLDLLR